MPAVPEIVLPAAWNQERNSEHLRIVALTATAFESAKRAVGYTADAVATGSPQSFQIVLECEKELDALDSEIDEHVSFAVTRASNIEARELLACFKCAIDLERIGDLLCSFASVYRAMQCKIEMQDVEELIRMACVVETMLKDVHQAFSNRDAEASLAVLRADSQVDRHRNLIFMRHLESRALSPTNASIHILMMAQALERVGDHTKNLAEEVCHLVSGHSMRHLAQQREQSYERMYLRWLRQSTILPHDPPA
jgi:phosphate transport system protein